MKSFSRDWRIWKECCPIWKRLRISRRTLQEYRTLGVIPYYLLQGKVLYKESDIHKMLEDAYKRCREEQRWV